MNLKERILKNSTIKHTSILADSKFFNNRDFVVTDIPMINVALSGEIDGGFGAGLTMISGPSKHFKTGFSLVFARAFLNKYDDAVILLYDSEFGSPEEYFKNFDIDLDRVIHSPITDVEQLKFDIMKQLAELSEKDKVLILIDSIGNLASKKEVEDALNEKSVADMSRAKQFKSLFRMVTPHLRLKNIPLIAINHTYKEIGLFPKDIVSGGTGGIYSSDTIWILGRQQDKQGTEIAGYNFIINVEKSRYVREKSKIPISISWEEGLNKWSGFLEQALEFGCVVKTKPGWYASVIDGVQSETSYREKQILRNDEFWLDILQKTQLAEHIKSKYKIGYRHEEPAVV